MIYVLAALLPPVGLLLNGQPFSAIFNLVLIVFSGWFFTFCCWCRPRTPSLRFT